MLQVSLGDSFQNIETVLYRQEYDTKSAGWNGSIQTK